MHFSTYDFSANWGSEAVLYLGAYMTFPLCFLHLSCIKFGGKESIVNHKVFVYQLN